MANERVEIGSLLSKLNYTKIKGGHFGESIFWKAENNIQKVVLVEDMWYRDIHTRASIERIRKVSKSFEGLKEENVLVVIVGSKEIMQLRGVNVIYMSLNDSTFKSHASNTFVNEAEAIKELCRYKKACRRAYLDSLGNQKKIHSTAMVYVLMALNTLVFAQTFLTGNAKWGASAATVFENGQSYRLITYMFVHAGVAHLVGNMASLLYIGKNLVRRIGTLDFAAVYVGGGVLAILSSMVYEQTLGGDLTTITVGASGAIFAILGALLMETMFYGDDFSKKACAKQCIFTLVMSSVGLRINVVAHVGGFCAGAILMYAINLSQESVINNDYVNEMIHKIRYRKRGVKNGRT